MSRQIFTMAVASVSILFTACSPSPSDTQPPPDTTPGSGGTSDTTPPPNGVSSELPATPPAQLLQPANLRYLGAFRLPQRAEGTPDEESWEYSLQGLAYRPDGDPAGAADGHPGSLFATAHETHNRFAELSIPAPSLSRDLEELSTATMLQGFRDVRAGLFDALEEMPRVGLQYLPAQGPQTSAKLYMTWGQHLQEEGTPAYTAPLAWCESDLAHPQTQGAWWVGEEDVYITSGYIIEIPGPWAQQHVGGDRLGIGRFRDGGMGSMGPVLFSISPWLEGNPPAPGAHLAARPLLRYSSARFEDASAHRMTGYQHSDEWEGGAWLTTGDGRSALIFAGTKGSGYVWYGFFSPRGDGMPCVEQGLTMVGCFNANGTECPASMQGECPGHSAESRGWWSSRFDAQILFYDPAQLAAVAAGTAQPHEPQPYAVLDIDEHLLLSATTDATSIGTGDQRRFRIGETAYDRERNLLYVPEKYADEGRPVIHVWRVE